MIDAPLPREAGLIAPSPSHPSVNAQANELAVEALAVLVRPSDTHLGPAGLVAFNHVNPVRLLALLVRLHPPRLTFADHM